MCLAGSKMDTCKRIQLPLLERSGYRGSIEVKIKSNVLHIIPGIPKLSRMELSNTYLMYNFSYFIASLLAMKLATSFHS